VSRRTVREEAADCLRGGRGPSEISTQTSSSALRKTDHSWWTRGLSASSQTVWHSSTDRPHSSTDRPKTSCNKTHQQNGSKERHSRTRKNSFAVRHLTDGLRWPRGWSAATSWMVRGYLADGPPGANQHSRVTRETTSNFRSTDLQTTWSLETKFWGDDEHPKVKICPKNYSL
jgi:hypothetical protein